jgi:hypothetical protein
MGCTMRKPQVAVRQWRSNGVAWQRQVRDAYADDPMPVVPHLDVGKAVVRYVCRQQAVEMIARYEWLGTMSATSRHFGIFFGDFCAGVTCVGGSGCVSGTGVAQMFDIDQSELAILARGACAHWAPSGTNSKLVSWTARLIRRECWAKLLMAYADPSAGEYGTIYQASNWAYVGPTESKYRLIAPDGRVRDEKYILNQARRANNISWREQRARLLTDGWRFVNTTPKFRYVCVLDTSNRALVERVEQMRQPYPKRPCVPSSGGAAAGFHPAEGGSTPTGTLQLDLFVESSPTAPTAASPATCAGTKQIAARG